MGLTQPSVLEILLTPSVLAPTLRSMVATAVAVSIPRHLSLQPPVNGDHQKGNPLLFSTHRLTTLLPPNVVLSTSSLSIVGIYRIMLIKSFQVSLENADRHLPQTGTLHSSSVLLSGFPKLIGKCNAFLYTAFHYLGLRCFYSFSNRSSVFKTAIFIYHPLSDLSFTNPSLSYYFYHFLNHYITSPHLTSPHLTSHHITSYHITSHHITS
jgi:hypothetical protein